MKIKTRLQINALIVLIVMCVVLMPLVWSLWKAAYADQNQSLVIEMQQIAYERVVLRDEYLLKQEVRAEAQWQAKTENFKKLLELARRRLPTNQDRLIIEEIKKSFEGTVFLFSKIKEYRGHKNINYENISISEEEKRLISKIIVSSYDMNAFINNLRESASGAKDTAQRISTFLVIFFMGIAVIVIAGNSIFIARTLASRIAMLHKGAKIFGSGNLNYRIPVTGNDEFADLAAASNEMAEKLQKSYTSVENLEKEIQIRKQAEDEIRKLKSFHETITESIVNGVWVSDKDDTIIYLNHGMSVIAGISPQSTVGLNLWKSYSEETVGEFKKHYMKGLLAKLPN